MIHQVPSPQLRSVRSPFSRPVSDSIGASRALPIGTRDGSLHLDYLYNDGDKLNNAFEPYEHIVSLWHQGNGEDSSLGIDLTYAAGLEGVSDIWGLTILPTWDIAHSIAVGGDLLQLAARYHYASSDDPGGLAFARRYEQEVATGEGDRYQSLYLGLNYLLYAHKLKFMAGAEYFDMQNVINGDVPDGSDVDGWNFAIGFRMYF